MKWSGIALAAAGLWQTASAKPDVPLSVDTRWIVGADGDRVKLRCVNWAGHLETNTPEGFNHQSVQYIVNWLADAGYTCVRLTYSIDMALNMDMTIEDSFKHGAKSAGVDEDDLMKLYNDAVEMNDWIDSTTTRIEAFEWVTDTLWDSGIVTILDNHVSKAQWCCNLTDGNAWWDDGTYRNETSRYFDTDDWYKGLEAMAKWSVGKPGIVGMSMRNEPRNLPAQAKDIPDLWLDHMSKAGDTVHKANPDLLIVIAGVKGGVDLSYMRGQELDTGDWADKRVWEAHSYSFSPTTINFGICSVEQAWYGLWFGFLLEDKQDQQGPLFLSEFGVGMTSNNGTIGDDDSDFLDCLVDYMTGNDADWAHWALQGSYYIREGQIGANESYGALDPNWKDWANPNFPNRLGKMWNVTQGPGVDDDSS